MNVGIGDWVRGRTEAGELIYGYVESVDLYQGIAEVYVMGSDHEEVVGKRIALPRHMLREMPVNTFDTEQPIKQLIDVALFSGDEAWFMELTEKLVSIQKSANARQSDISNLNMKPNNRFGLSGLK
ncbi:IDEAL domain-containing protein [Paenibacillus hexagrammi]|uniref:IDEAL domain-containing protein n=1 Tax=Paenibacillus hexagrammi TaxID=2908839 RepID=A0ABY3SMJ0_9BACL|nr:IDEAL domain-containing protein [Paenibacillus sp. YPD9-1]UJF34416.1 IDEAL domain-containing protein [Paenibacillus sp. YPD9-1]